MSSLKTSFAGLDLKNPIVVSSSSLTDNAEGCLRFEKAGAGAVVLKSLFEEDVVRRTESLTDETAHSESADYLQGYLRGQMLGDYLKLVKESKALCSIPVIASICCCTAGEWTDFARMIEQAGAEALGLKEMRSASEQAAAAGAS